MLTRTLAVTEVLLPGEEHPNREEARSTATV